MEDTESRALNSFPLTSLSERNAQIVAGLLVDLKTFTTTLEPRIQFNLYNGCLAFLCN